MRGEGKGLRWGGVTWRVDGEVVSEELEGKGEKRDLFSPSMNLRLAAENNEKTRQLPRILFPYPDIENIFLHQPSFHSPLPTRLLPFPQSI